MARMLFGFLMMATLIVPTAASAAKTTMRMAFNGALSETEILVPYVGGVQLFAKIIAEKSNGDLELKIFPSNQLGTQREVTEGTMMGTIDMTMTTFSVLGNFVPQIAVFDLPFIFRSAQHSYRVMDTIALEMSPDLEKRGIKLLCVMDNGARLMTNSKRPIRKPEDMKGLKMRVMQQPVYIDMMKLLGASPTPMDMTEVYTSLEKGVIDGQENPIAQIDAFKLMEVQKYISYTEHSWNVAPMVISMKTWNKLTPEQQKIMQETALEILEEQRKMVDVVAVKNLERINALNAEINRDVDKQAFMEATRGAWQNFSKKVSNGQELIDRVVATKE